MKEFIIIKDRVLEYEIKKNRRTKHLRLSVYPEGRVLLTLPWWTSLRVGKNFISSKAEWILTKLNQVAKKRAWPIKINKNEYHEHKAGVLEFVKERLVHFNQFYNFKINRVSIKKTTTRWGSCSRLGNLNFNYRILWLPSHLADYIIVHELCHLGELNHSSRFWRLVEKTLPNYQALRKELKK